VHKAVLDAFEQDNRAYYLLVAWLWDRWANPLPKIGTALFRCPTDEILRYGQVTAPEWFRELDEVTRERTVPTALDRLMGDDEL